MTKRMTDQERIKDCKNWSQRTDIDIMLLEDRTDYCKMIRPEIEQLFVDVLVKSGIVKSKDFKFAPTKLIERSSEKLLEYLEKIRKE